ncbi:putative nuclease HARBI1 [Drosophila ficusphila]|uniref:putative nuclease HARBI1 n=1 Tax=Drosophila ficusphila TaxID=30025 RepID=UPI0007E81A70|nr:putative nuclease HARBI1 [Drosophila ficusphila]
MEDLQIFERSLKDFEYLKDFQQFPHPKRNVKVRATHLKKSHPRFNPLTDLNENQFRIKYRYTKENLRRIIEIVRDDLEIEYYEPLKREQVPIDLQILSAIRLWGGTEHPKLTAMAHGVRLRTLAKITRRVASVLSSKASRYIRMPATLSEKERMMCSFQAIANMPQVIGALLQTTVRFQPENTAPEDLDEENPFPPKDDELHLQIVCDAAHKIRDLDIRLIEENSMPSDTEMFALSKIKERFEQNEFRGRILLGDEMVRCSSSLFTPVRFPKNESEELYNHAHSITYASARKCLNLLMSRFGILSTEIAGSYGSAKQTITALSILHNMAMEWADPSIDTEQNISPFNSTFFNSIGRALKTGEDNNRKQFIKTHFACQ